MLLISELAVSTSIATNLIFFPRTALVAIIIKEQRAEEVKHHLTVLWADFFTKDHFEQFPNLHQLFWDGVHGAGDVKKSTDVAVAEKLLATIDQISDVFWQTEKSKDMGVYPPA